MSSAAAATATATAMRLFDAHCHLQDQRVLAVAPDVIRTALGAGVRRFAVNGVSEGDWQLVKQLARDHPSSVIPCFGLHPWYVKDRSPDWLETMKKLFDSTPEAAVGEIGLDKGSRGKQIDFAEQVQVFEKQLELAKALQKPVAVHCVHAFGDLLEIMRCIGPFPAGVILHSYLGSAEMVPELTKLGSYFSFSGYLLSLKPQKAKKMLRSVPLDRILLESDAPDALPKFDTNSLFFIPGDPSVSPQLQDSCKDSASSELNLPQETYNHPANIRCILSYVAEQIGMPEVELAEASYRNAIHVFSYPGSNIQAKPEDPTTT